MVRSLRRPAIRVRCYNRAAVARPFLSSVALALLALGCSSASGGGPDAAADRAPSADGDAASDPADLAGDGSDLAVADLAVDSADASDLGGETIAMQDIPPWRALAITVPAGPHVHTTSYGLTAGFDNRSAKMAGKLVLDIGVVNSVLTGSYRADLGHRGFHVIGVQDVNACDAVDDWTLGRDFEGNCRLNNLDGLPHGDQSTVTPEQSIMHQVLDTLTVFEATYPGEGWGYFLTQDGTGVRWSDVILTGISHCAQDAACFAHQLRVSGVVAASGPRDNTCGKGLSMSDYDPANPPWWPLADACDDTHCCLAHIASWIDAPSATPIDRYYGFVGMKDVQYGDIMFTMERMAFVGQPVNVETTAPPYGGSHRFYANVAHGDLGWYPYQAFNIAFGVLPENLVPGF